MAATDSPSCFSYIPALRGREVLVLALVQGWRQCMHIYIYIRIYITIVSFQQLPAMARPRLGGKSKDNLPLNLTARLDSGARNELDFGGCYRKEILRNLQNPRSLQCVHLPESLSPLRKCVVWGCAETEIGRCVAKPLSPKSATARRTGSPC